MSEMEQRSTSFVVTVTGTLATEPMLRTALSTVDCWFARAQVSVTALLPDAAIVTDPAGLWALIDRYASHAGNLLPIGEQIRAALGLDSTP